jgi:uncharacterized coiled-coil protein SlyX
LKKLIHLLAVSAGGGLLLGAGIKLAERRRGQSAVAPDVPGPDSGSRLSLFLSRLEALEQALGQLERKLASQNGDPHGGREEIARELDAMESRLRSELERIQERRIESLNGTLNRSGTTRLEAIESELAGQRGAVAELRECSIRTERSLQKLVQGIDRLVDSQTTNGPVTGMKH